MYVMILSEYYCQATVQVQIKSFKYSIDFIFTVRGI